MKGTHCMIELKVDWQAIINLDDIPDRDADGDDTGASDPLRSEYGNLFGFCDDPTTRPPDCGGQELHTVLRPRPAEGRFVCVPSGS